MNGVFSATAFRFLFRTDQGTIDRSTWWKAVGAIAGAWLIVVEAQSILNRSGDITKLALTAAFVLAAMFLSVCYYFVSAKRFNDRGKPTEFALVLPAAIFVDAGLHWLGPSLVSFVPNWSHYLVDGIAIAAAVWNITELGVLPGLHQTGQ
jgi:uncharacterized membrane protein YhaH (DUF805 family)